MIISLEKFGTTLISRQAGKEAYAAFLPSLQKVTPDENVIVDFDGVITFSPSWGDEFLSPLQTSYGSRLSLKNTSNPSVKATLSLLEQIHKYSLRIEN